MNVVTTDLGSVRYIYVSATQLSALRRIRCAWPFLFALTLRHVTAFHFVVTPKDPPAWLRASKIRVIRHE